MSREEFLKALEQKQENIADILRKFVYTASKEDIARVLIEYDYALWQAEKERACYLDDVIESLEGYWNE